MTVHCTTGDLFETPEFVGLAHGCNCAGAMGKGIALQFRQRFPGMYQAYRRACDAGEFELGDVFVWQAEDRTVFNLATQKHWRSDAELSAIRESTAEMLAEAERLKIEIIALPQIGAGLGGLEWEEVKQVILDVASDSDVSIVVVEEFERGRAPSLPEKNDTRS